MMFQYITFRQTPKFSVPSLDDLLFGTGELKVRRYSNGSGTVTYCTSFWNKKVETKHWASPYNMFVWLHHFVYSDPVQKLLREDLHSHYRQFKIPKRSGGLRTINAPDDELSAQLNILRGFIEENVLYHTNAYAYVKGRCTVDAVKKHQRNESNWFGKFDLHDFFGSTTIDFVMNMLSIIYPFSQICSNPVGYEDLRAAISLGFLDGGLPQGTPLSPTITNLIMVPFDFDMSKLCNENGYIYTRYADDILISSRKGFNANVIESYIKLLFQKHHAPYQLNTSKTRYGSRAGSNWNLGVMLNRDNNITVGHKNKKKLQNMLHNYARDKRAGVAWDLSDVQELAGIISYYKMVEGDVITSIIQHHSKKMRLNILEEIKRDLRR